MELDALIDEVKLIDRLCFTSLLHVEFFCLLIRMQDLFLPNFGGMCVL